MPRARRRGGHPALLLIDIDSFESCHNHSGCHAGNARLSSAAQALADNLKYSADVDLRLRHAPEAYQPMVTRGIGRGPAPMPFTATLPATPGHMAQVSIRRDPARFLVQLYGIKSGIHAFLRFHIRRSSRRAASNP